MATPQAGLFVDTSMFHYHLEYRVSETTSLQQIANVVNEIAASDARSHEITIGIRPSLWVELRGAVAPDNCNDFETIHGIGGRIAPSTQNDFWIWIHSLSHDINFDAALEFHNSVREHAQLQVDVCGFVRRENRDLTGFVDGSANPTGQDIFDAALVPEGHRGSAGSFALTQRWVHDLNAFNTLSTSEQEAVIGRTKADSIELVGDAMPEDSHVSRTDVKIDGEAFKIYRRSVPYGNIAEHGLFFIAFACEQKRIQVQLERMFGVWQDGLHDKLIHFSTAVSGSYWFVPSTDELREL